MKARRRKTVRIPVMAAGGIVIRNGRRPLFAIVQRRKDSCWVLPKGKLKRGEKLAAGARREAIEETGHSVRQHEFLGAITSEIAGRQKVVHFWRMEATRDASHALANDIKTVAWLPLAAAIDRLSQPVERTFLDHVGAHALRLSRADNRATDDKTRKQSRSNASRGSGAKKSSRPARTKNSRRKTSRGADRARSRSDDNSAGSTSASVAAPQRGEKNIIRRFLGKLRHNAALT